MGRLGVALAAVAFILLATSTTHGAYLKKTGGYNEAKMERIRELAKAAGAPQSDSAVNQEDVCLEEGCLDAALDLLSAINMSVDPCKDFFQYTCGRWFVNNPIPPTISRWSRFQRLREEVNNITQTILNEDENDQDAKPINQVKQFYKSCIDVDAIEAAGLEPLQSIISDFGGWQMLNPLAWNSSFSWLNATAEVRRRTLRSAIISANVGMNMKNTSNAIVCLDQPDFGLPRGVLITPENYTALMTAYKTYIVDVAKELGTTQSDANLNASADAIINLEVAMAKISSSEQVRYEDIERIYNPFLLNEYQDITDGIDGTFSINWKAYLDQVFSSSGVSISNNEPIVVHELDYVKNLMPILKAAEPTTVANYIVWRLVSGLVPDTTASMRNITFKFQQALFGQQVPPTRDFTCANAAAGVFGMAIGVKYIEATFDKDAKAEVEQLVENLRVSFKEMVTESDWMEDVTKVEAIAKADAIRSFMAYPEWLENKTAVEKFYEGLELSNTYFNTQLSLALYRMNGGLKSLREPTDRDQWVMTPGVVNAAYYPELNSITFPAGILQPPFFGKVRPKSLSYGGIGVVIGHEMTHGFDNRGSQFDKDGNVQNWWDNVTKVEYNRRAQCMSDQYSAFYSVEAGLYVNGELTLGENIADNGGLRESYKAYQKYVEENGPEGRLPGLENLSTDQLFFIGFASVWCESITPEALINQMLTDPHSPPEFRVKGPVRNNLDFAKAYNCPIDSEGMNPPESEKCTVW